MNDRNVKAKKPLYQLTLQRIGWLILGVFALGTLLDAINNARSVITPSLTYIFSAIVIVAWILIEILLKRWHLPWVTKDGLEIRLRGLGNKIRFGMVGFIVLLWIPRMANNPLQGVESFDEESIQLSAGSNFLAYDQEHEIVYAIIPSEFATIPSRLDTFAFFTTYIPLWISNIGKKTIEDITIVLQYQANPKISITKEMKQQTLGVKEKEQVRRRTESFEGIDMSILSVDYINPRQGMILNEPIDLPIEMIKSPLNDATIAVNVSAKDFPVRNLYLNIKCLTGNSFKEVQSYYHYFVYTKAVANRERSSFFNYLKQSVTSDRVTATYVLPAFQLAQNSEKKFGFLSDSMHDKITFTSYEPAPLEYLYAPIWHSLKSKI